MFELGGFHPDGMPPELLRFKGDDESGFFQKFKQQGFSAWYNPRSVAYHRESQKRMTFEYLKQRSYNQGIPDSYSQICIAAGLDVIRVSSSGGIKQKSLVSFAQRKRKMSFADRLEWLSNRIQGIRRRLLPTRSGKIRHQLYAANRAGREFHQSVVQADPELLAFILKILVWNNLK